MASVEQPVQSLSGGNQQKVSLTRPFLRGDVKVILAEEPTQGVDVAARFDIYEALRAKAGEGVAVIVKSSDPLELAGLCDRVVVMSRGKIVDEIRGEDLGERRIVEAIVGSRRGCRPAPEPRQRGGRMTFGARVAAAVAQIRFRGVVPLVLMSTLILAVGAYTAVRQDAFLSSYNLNNLLLATMPLALVSMGQTCALLVGGFDVSVGALMTLCVVVASYTMTPTTSQLGLIPGALALVGVGLATGVFNAVLIRVFRLPSIIATLATFSILEGAALLLRDHPEGSINLDVVDALTTSWSFVPLAFIGVVVLALLADVWLYRTRAGLAFRAVGLDETASRRLGMGTSRTVILAFVACSVMASIAGFYLAPRFRSARRSSATRRSRASPPPCLAAPASRVDRGSFVGALLAALFLSLIDNILPLFQAPTEYAEMTIGILILVALILYQAPELLARLRTSWGGVGRLRAGRGDARQADRHSPYSVLRAGALTDELGDSLIWSAVSMPLKDSITPFPFVTALTTDGLGGFRSSRFGPTVPLAPAAARVWQVEQPASMKTAFPSVPSRAAGHPHSEAPRERPPSRLCRRSSSPGKDSGNRSSPSLSSPPSSAVQARGRRSTAFSSLPVASCQPARGPACRARCSWPTPAPAGRRHQPGRRGVEQVDIAMAGIDLYDRFGQVDEAW